MIGLRIFRHMRAIFAALLAIALACPAAVADEALPLPRFVSLKSNEVNVRRGPSRDHQILWTYQMRGLPVEIIAEYDVWRQVRDWEGGQGWVYRGLLSGDRTVMVLGDRSTMYLQPVADTRRVAELEPGVVAELIACEIDWCRVSVEGYTGWIDRTRLWGVYPDEIVAP